MAKKILLVSPVLVCAAVITGLVLSGVGGAGQEASPAELEQAKAEIRTLIKSREFALADAAIADLIDKFSTNPALPGALYETAREYRWVKKYGRAKSMYQDIMRDYPESVAAGRAQLGLARVDVLFLMQSGEVEAAQAAIDSQVQVFAGHPDLPETLYWLAKEHEWKLDLEQAKSTYQHMLNACPDSSCATKAELGLARVTVAELVEFGDLAAANPAFEKMVADFNEHPDLRETLYWIAKRYEGQDAFEQAKEIYWLIIERWPGSDEAEKSRLDIRAADVFAFVRGERHDEVSGAIDELIVDFEGDAYLPYIVWITGEEYYYEPALELWADGRREEAKDYFAKGIPVFERVIQNFPSSAEAGAAYYYSAECHRYLGQYEKAIEYYQTVYTDWPDFKYVCSTPGLIGCCYDELKKNGSLPQAEADLLIEQSYQWVLEEYPDCYIVDYAALRLGEINYDRGDWTAAEAYYELFLETAHPNDSQIEKIQAKLKELQGLSN